MPEAVPENAARVARGASADVLARIAQPGTGAAIWARGPDPRIADWLSALPEAALPATRQTCAAGEAGVVIDAACAAAGIPASAGQQRLRADVGALAREFGRIMGVEALQLRLDVIRDDACRKFHLDQVVARLLCSYRGAGTEYGPAAPGETPAEVRRMATGDVGIFRGALWRGEPAPGLVHRSPPFSRGSVLRLLLVLDPLETRAEELADA